MLEQFEIISMSLFDRPYRRTANGAWLMARFNARYGPVHLLNLILAEDAGGAVISFAGATRERRCWVSSTEACQALAMAASEYRAQHYGPLKARVAVRDGNNQAGDAG